MNLIFLYDKYLEKSRYLASEANYGQIKAMDIERVQK